MGWVRIQVFCCNNGFRDFKRGDRTRDTESIHARAHERALPLPDKQPWR